jgi:hypothetical protein
MHEVAIATDLSHNINKIGRKVKGNILFQLPIKKNNYSTLSDLTGHRVLLKSLG